MTLMLSRAGQCISLAVVFDAIDFVTCMSVNFPNSGF